MVVATPLGPVGNFLYKGATQPRSFYQNMSLSEALASENPFSSKYTGYNPSYKGVGPKVGPLNYFGQGLKSVFGYDTTGNIAGGTPGARFLYEKIRANPFARGLGYFGKAATGLPGLAATSLYGLSEQMKPGSAMSNFIKQGPTKYQKLQNELKQKQMQAQKKSLEDRFKNINVENVKKMTNYVTGQQLHGNLKGPKSDQKGKKGGINRKDPKGGIGGGLGGIHK